MSTGLQAKMLQVLQDREFTRLGGNKEMKEFFVQMEERIEFNEFERWLLKTWN